jgi:hypothetical protein
MQHRNHQIIWAAGFFDGEGCIEAAERTIRPRLSVGQIAIAPLERLESLFGGRVSTPSTGYSHWTLSGTQNVRKALEAMEPYLLVKKEQAHIIFRLCDLVLDARSGRKIPTSNYEERERICMELKGARHSNAQPE